MATRKEIENKRALQLDQIAEDIERIKEVLEILINRKECKCPEKVKAKKK